MKKIQVDSLIYKVAVWKHMKCADVDSGSDCGLKYRLHCVVGNAELDDFDDVAEILDFGDAAAAVMEKNSAPKKVEFFEDLLAMAQPARHAANSNDK